MVKKHRPEAIAKHIAYKKIYNARPEVKAQAKARIDGIKADPVKWEAFQKAKSDGYLRRKEDLEWLANSRAYSLEYSRRPDIIAHRRQLQKIEEFQIKKAAWLKEYWSRPEVREMMRRKGREWKRKNPGKAQALDASRRAAKLQRTPFWVDKKAIREIYIRCAALRKEYGISLEVDHRVPLQGKRVSGLHVDWNLDIITGVENWSKGNRFNAQDELDNGIWYGADYYINGWTFKT